MQKGIDAYFKSCDEKEKPYTMTGLAIALGICRKTLVNYSNSDLFYTLIKNAKAKVEEQLEESLYRLGNNSGVIFNLKNNYGWVDKQEQEVVSTNRYNIINDLPKDNKNE